MNRATILAEIRRVALANGGAALGQNQFEKLSGISQGVWRGKFWLRWSEAVAEAGFAPGKMQEAHPDEFLLERLAELTRQCGHFPTSSETRMQRVNDKSFPTHGVFDRIGTKLEKIAKLREFAQLHSAYADILDLLPREVAEERTATEHSGERPEKGDGHVYMLKLGKHYKIGRTFAVPRRHREIALELPEKPDIVHSMSTDDPEGIEAYWHRRFARKQTNGEWFALDAEDVRVFKRRRFM